MIIRQKVPPDSTLYATYDLVEENTRSPVTADDLTRLPARLRRQTRQ